MEGENLSKAIGENPPEQNPDGPTDQEPIPETPAKINTEEKTGADESKEIVQKNDSIPEPSNPQPTEPQPVITTTPKTEEQVASPLKKLGIQDFDLLTILGKGSFGEVTLARKKDSQKLYAMKIIDKVFLYRVQFSHLPCFLTSGRSCRKKNNIKSSRKKKSFVS